jgi:hypothetical protein
MVFPWPNQPILRDRTGDEPTVILKSTEVISEPIDHQARIAVLRIVEFVERRKRTRYCVRDLENGYYRTKERLSSPMAWTQSHAVKGRWETQGDALSKIASDCAARQKRYGDEPEDQR